MQEVYSENSAAIDEIVQAVKDILEKRIVASQKKVDPNQLLAVRSSSTLEDLDQMAGAGLFDSILNVKLSAKDEITDALIGVWLSLHTQRATISRKQNSIKTCHA